MSRTLARFLYWMVLTACLATGAEAVGRIQ